MTERDDMFSVKEAQSALLRSGYLLESRLDTVLRENDYFVESNTVYPDPVTEKVRELDLHAMTAHKAGPEEAAFLFPVLLVECQNNPVPIAFITKDIDGSLVEFEEIKISGLPVKVEENRGEWVPLPAYLNMAEYHHYASDRVATQWCSFVKKKAHEEWMAYHDDSHFESLQKLASAVDHYRDGHFRGWVIEEHEPVNLQIYYPILVLQGELYDARPTARSVRLRRADYLQFSLTTIQRGEEQTYRIDVATERYFPKLIEAINQETAKMARVLRRRHGAIRTAIDSIVREAKRLRSPEKIKRALEW